MGRERLVRRHAKAALPEFAAAALANVAAELVLRLDELCVVIVGAIARASALGELGAVAQSERADVEVGARAAVGHFLQQLLAYGAGEVLEIARHLDEGARAACHAMQVVAAEIRLCGGAVPVLQVGP